MTHLFDLALRRYLSWHPLLLLSTALFFAGHVQAAGMVRYALSDPDSGQQGQFAVEWRSPTQLRMDVNAPGMPAGTRAYQLLLQDKLYSVTHQGGDLVVMEMGPLLRMAGRMAPARNWADPGDGVHEVLDLRDTGRSERLAGIDGTVFELDYRDAQGQNHTQELVLSQDPTVYQLTQAMGHYARVMAQALGQPAAPGRDQLDSRLQGQRVGLLRMGQTLRAVQVSAEAPAAERFQLPASPMALPAMPELGALGALMTGAAAVAAAGKPPGRAASQADGDTALAREAERQKERQKQRLGQQAQEEADRAADKAVDKALKGLWDRLRNR